MGADNSAPTPSPHDKTAWQAMAAILGFFNGLIALGAIAGVPGTPVLVLVLMFILGAAGACCGYLAYKRQLYSSLGSISIATLVLGVLLRVLG